TDEEISVAAVIREVETGVATTIEEARRRGSSATEAAELTDRRVREAIRDHFPVDVIDSLTVMKGKESR
ncbi:MAG: hypothetical protein ACOCV0_02340, partial [Alkalispirochaeta sp.]